MRKDFGSEPWLFPQPVLIIGTYDEKGVPNAMNAAWGGTYDYKEVFVSLSDHKTTDNLKLKKVFTLSFATKSSLVAADYVGIVSGRKVPNKVEKAGLHAFKSSRIDAPLFEEFPLTMECEVEKFENGILIGKVLNVSADSSILSDGKVDVNKLEAIVYDPIGHNYLLAKEIVGKAFVDGKKIK